MKIYVSTVVEKKQKILMVREKKSQCYGKWNFPSGHVEEDEYITNAAIREVKEEINLDVNLTGLIAIYNNMFESFNSIAFVYSSEIKKENEIRFNKDEIIETRWFSFEEIKNMKKELRDYNYVIESLERYKGNDIKDINTIIKR